MPVEGKLVLFVEVPLDSKGRMLIPRGMKKVGEVSENNHVFYETKYHALYMRNCVGDWFEIEGDFEDLSYEEISYDYENAPDLWGEEIHCDRPKRRPGVRVREHQRRR